jgi:hypothetical protein
MPDDSISDRLLPAAGGAHRAEPSVQARTALAGPRRTAGPIDAAGTADIDMTTEYDIVDLQSMQSFPASDPPAWPSEQSVLATGRGNEADVSPSRPPDRPAR